MRRPHLRGTTLLDVMLAVTIIGILGAVAVPRIGRTMDAIAVHGAVSDSEALLATARHLALARETRASVRIDTAARTLTLLAGSDTVKRWDEGAVHGVLMRSTRIAVTYSPIGVGYGATNLTLVFARGAAAETVYVSRLGRVRQN